MRDDILRKRFERHLADCPNCAIELAEYREMIDALTVPSAQTTAELLAPARIIPFPLRRYVGRPALRRLRRAGRRFEALSVSATILLMALVVLAHTGHLEPVERFGDAAWLHVSHVSHKVIERGVQLTHKWKK